MTALFKKLQYKTQKEICILNAPDSFEPEIKSMQEITSIKLSTKGLKEIGFVLTFVQTEKEIEEAANKIFPLLKNEFVCWFAYPKGTSKKYKVLISRDKGWNAIGEEGYEAVSAVAIDEDWSGLRFKKAEDIKTITRNKKIAISVAGRKRAV
jgi:hypothetical protein